MPVRVTTAMRNQSDRQNSFFVQRKALWCGRLRGQDRLRQRNDALQLLDLHQVALLVRDRAA